MQIQRRRPIDSRAERQLVTGLIVSEKFIQEIRPILKPQILQLPFAKTVTKWCLDFHNIHKSAPKQIIQDIFVEKRKRELDEAQAEAIEEFLTSISDEYEKQENFNVDYYLKKSELYLRELSIKKLEDELKRARIGGRIEEAEAIIKGYERIQRPISSGIDPINDSQAIVEAFSEDTGDRLFSLPGALGQLMGVFERGWLVGVVGSAKAGKSWWLMLTALRALFAGFNVLFVSLEMSEKAMIRRIHHYINGKPTRKWAGEMLIPVFDCEHNQFGTCQYKSKRINKVDLVEDEGGLWIPKNTKQFDEITPTNYRPCTECMGERNYSCTNWFKKATKEELTINQIMKKKQAIKRSALIRGSKFHLVSFPSGSLAMSELNAYIYNLEQYDGFVPDVIITDYADKMRPERYNEFRHGINEIWEGHKGLAQDKNALVVTGSQSNTARTGKRIGQGDWAEDIRKLNLIDAGFGLNINAELKARGLMDIGVLAQRHDYFDVIGKAWVLHQLKIGRPYLGAYSAII